MGDEGVRGCRGCTYLHRGGVHAMAVGEVQRDEHPGQQPRQLLVQLALSVRGYVPGGRGSQERRVGLFG